MTEYSASVEERVDATAQTEARAIANFAWQHLRAACTFRDQVIAIETAHEGQELSAFFEDLRSYGSACIMSASASLEALINEFFITPGGPLRPKLVDFEREFWGRGGIEWRPPLEKYQIALRMLGKPELDEAAPPFRPAWALIELRNALIHHKPDWDPVRKRKADLVQELAGQYTLSPFVNGGADFVTMKSMSAGCMHWVTGTTAAFLREFDARTRMDDDKMTAFWQLPI